MERKLISEALSLFEPFSMGTLCVSAGFSGGVSFISNVVLLIAGFPALIFAPLTFFYGEDHSYGGGEFREEHEKQFGFVLEPFDVIYQ